MAKVKSLRLLLLVSGDIDDILLNTITTSSKTNVVEPILEAVAKGNLIAEIVGTMAKIFICEACGAVTDLDENEEEEDVTCSECNMGPLCYDCFESHICDETENED
jgi:hypothetical protein